MYRQEYPKEVKEHLMKYGTEHTIIEWLEILKEKFNMEYSKKSLRQYFCRNDIKYKYLMPKCSHDKLGYAIGSERTKSDGMVQVKVAPKKWVYKQRKIYEDYYGVKLPEDIYVIFLDQNRRNFDITNLKAISRHESAVMSNMKVFSKDKDVTETGVLLAQLRIKEKEVKLKGF